MTIPRRTFLASTAAFAAAGLWSATRSRAFAAEPTGVTDADLAELRKLFGPRLVAPSDKTYDLVRKVRNRDFDGVRPRAIVMAASVDDVVHAVQWAAAHNVPIVPRGGGHSYIGQSTSEGLVVSLVNMKSVAIDKPAMTAEVDAGALLVDVNVALLQGDVALPTGSCPSVGVAGLTLGGGIGFSSRKWGLMSDNLAAVTMVCPSGKVIHADATHLPEVLWACRGGGGGQFGIVTGFRFGVHEVEPISEYNISWPWASADRALDAWQRWAPDAPDELFAVCMLSRGKTEPSIHSHGRFHGSAAELRKLLAPLVAAVKPSAAPKVSSSTLWGSHVVGPKCWPDPSACHSWNHPEPGRYQQATYMVKSDYFRTHLSDQGRHTLIKSIEGMQREAISWGGIILDALGGAINRVPKDATAYVHRDSLFQAEYVAHWNPKLSEAKLASNRGWMRGFYEAMRPYASGECYQNYADLDLPNWQEAYFGANLPRLQRCKKMLDPNGVFRGRQVIEPAS